MFDLTVFPLMLDAGREHYELPGFLAAGAPRKAARMRQQDQLILYWKVIRASGSGGFTPAQQQEILTRLSETYFTTAGSVTAGLRAAAVRLNDFLLRRNLRAGQDGQLSGLMTLAALHGDTVYIANAGPVHAFVLGKSQVLHFYNDPAGSGAAGARGLGVSRTPAIRFQQASVSPGDLLLVTPDAPAGWTEKSLAGSPQISFDHLRRRLLAEAGVELQAVVVRLQSGKGQVTHYHPPERGGAATPAPAAPVPAVSAPAVSAPAAPAPADPAGPITEIHAPPAAPAADEPGPGLAEEEPPAQDSIESGGGEVLEEISVESAPAVLQVAEDDFDLPAFDDSQPDTPLLDADEPGAAQSYALPTGEEAEADEPQPVFLGQEIEAGAPAGDEPPAPRPPVEHPSPETGQMVTPEASKWHSAPRRKRTAAGTPADGAAPSAKPAQKAQKPRPPAGPPVGLRLRRSMASAWNKTSPARDRSRAALGTAITAGRTRLFPRRTEPLINLSPAWMLLIALLVPLAVVTAATTVYFEAGRGEQFHALMAQAQFYAQQARQAEDPAQVKAGWSQAYTLVLRAETYGASPESNELRRQALSVIDSLDGIVRLNYQPAINGSLPPGTHITRMVPTLNDIFLLDSSQGRILRLARTTSSTYEFDPNFICGPGQAGDVTVGPLIDLAPLPIANELKASILGIDASGNLVYCTGKAAFVSRTLTPPDIGWNKIVGITTLGDTLYVLDPGSNAVYYYNGSGGVYATPPHLYFDSEIPFMSDVFDLAVDQEFLYLLHRNGRMTLCASGAFTFAPTRCTDPAPFGDSRLGYEPAPLFFEGASFTQIQTTQPPDPSLFILDEANQAIYHFSLRKLNLQRQYRAYPFTDFPLPANSPTAFVVTPNRRALLAFGSQLFFAPLP